MDIECKAMDANDQAYDVLAVSPPSELDQAQLTLIGGGFGEVVF
jgi:hypothetical protein